jgi:hypothetical protein
MLQVQGDLGTVVSTEGGTVTELAANERLYGPSDIYPTDRLQRNTQLGATMARAGLRPDRIAAIMVKVEQHVRDSVLELLPEFVQLATDAKADACAEIESYLDRPGTMYQSLHANCLRIVRQVATRGTNDR